MTVPSSKPNPDKPNPKLGVGMMRWSADGQFLATRNGACRIRWERREGRGGGEGGKDLSASRRELTGVELPTLPSVCLVCVSGWCR